MTYKAAKRKLTLELIGMFPFVLIGKIAGIFFRLKTRHSVFLFFPNGDIGGSPQVNIDLTNCIKDTKPLIIFSKKPTNNQFRDQYKIDGVRVLDIHEYIDNKLFHVVNFFFRGLLATWINSQQNAVVIGGESIFFYKIIPHVNKNVRKIEICHLDTWLPYSIKFIDLIDCRIFSTENLKQKVIEQYQVNNLRQIYFSKLFFIDNAIDIPVIKETVNNELQVYFIGRGAAQKRVHLIAAIAQTLHDRKKPVKFNFVGNVTQVINIENYPFCNFYGNVKDPQKMKSIYENADVLLMTSLFEGLPVVIMQMMAYGKVVISTAVNGIPDYIHHLENGFLIRSTDEQEIIDEAAVYMEQLLDNPALRKKLGDKSRAIAIEKFNRRSFCSNYRKIIGLE